VRDLEDVVELLQSGQVSQAESFASLAHLTNFAADRLSVVLEKRLRETTSLESLLTLALSASSTPPPASSSPSPSFPMPLADGESPSQPYYELTPTDDGRLAAEDGEEAAEHASGGGGGGGGGDATAQTVFSIAP
jgi:hypothetical protein